MKLRRSKFFAKALKDIGKTHEQIMKEVKDKAKSRREIPLNPYFQQAKGSKRFLRRTGSLDFDKDQKTIEDPKKENFIQEEDNFSQSPSQMGDNDFEKELKKIKEEMLQDQLAIEQQ